MNINNRIKKLEGTLKVCENCKLRLESGLSSKEIETQTLELEMKKHYNCDLDFSSLSDDQLNQLEKDSASAKKRLLTEWGFTV